MPFIRCSLKRAAFQTVTSPRRSFSSACSTILKYFDQPLPILASSSSIILARIALSAAAYSFIFYCPLYVMTVDRIGVIIAFATVAPTAAECIAAPPRYASPAPAPPGNDPGILGFGFGTSGLGCGFGVGIFLSGSGGGTGGFLKKSKNRLVSNAKPIAVCTA